MTASEGIITRKRRDRRRGTRDEGDRLDNLVRRNPLPSVRPLAWVIMILIATAVVWAFLTRLDEVTIAEGEIVPQGQVRVIQHLEGGIIEEIYVTEGSVVSAGDSLVQISLAVSEVNREELQISLDALLIRRARLEAEASGTGSCATFKGTSRNAIPLSRRRRGGDPPSPGSSAKPSRRGPASWRARCGFWGWVWRTGFGTVAPG